MENSEKLYVSKIDMGNGLNWQICSGLRDFIPEEEMKGLVVILANLKPRKMAGVESQGMIMCGVSDN